MRSLMFASATLLGMSAAIALAQAPAGLDPATGARPGHEPGVGVSLPLSNNASNMTPNDTRSVIAPTLPPSAAGPNATPQDYLRAARASLAAGQTGATQQSLEMAETRALDRAVPVDQTDDPGTNRLIATIRNARDALAAGDTQHTMQMIDQALSS
ncbi:hypothetical protein [Acidisphaera sp. S103]|uniref:hypothetical protein n=1 Tax=Acidisphaera sp. S103 TaxID=1747223 RepID=UPI00131C74FF|nr:hypothetical protein [Acidisphaera sp. S103]